MSVPSWPPKVTVFHWPHHYRDDGGWCRWSAVAHRTADIPCPDGCSESLELPGW